MFFRKKPKVSIIVPIYGVEKYLEQCVDSILAQTLKEIEIILVDDGSPDACPQIIDAYAKQDKRIVALHQENGGYGKAVNHGIEKAGGKYIGIVEPDDWIEPDMYETLYNDAEKYGVDIVKGTYYEVLDKADGSYKRQPAFFMQEIMPPHNPFNIYEYPMPLQRHASIWAALYRTDFIRKYNIKMLEQNKGRYADQNWRFETLMQAQSIYWEEKPFYNYRIFNENSSSHKKNNPDDVFEIYDALEVFMNKHSLEYAQIREYLYIEIFRHMFWNLERVDKKYRKYCLEKIHKKFQNMLPSVVENSDLFGKEEKRIFKDMRKSNYYTVMTLKKARDWLFSVKESPSRRHIVITILGLTLKKKNTKRNL